MSVVVGLSNYEIKLLNGAVWAPEGERAQATEKIKGMVAAKRIEQISDAVARGLCVETPFSGKVGSLSVLAGKRKSAPLLELCARYGSGRDVCPRSGRALIHIIAASRWKVGAHIHGDFTFCAEGWTKPDKKGRTALDVVYSRLALGMVFAEDDWYWLLQAVMQEADLTHECLKAYPPFHHALGDRRVPRHSPGKGFLS